MNEAVLLDMAVAYAEAVRARLRTPWRLTVLPTGSDPAAIAEALGRARAVVLTRFDGSLPLGPEIELLQVGGAGLDAVDLAAVPPRVAVCNAFGHEDGMAEYVIAAILAWRHRLLEMAASFKAGSWRFSGHIGDPPHGEAAGATLGIVGLGRIGTAIASRAAALGLEVLACNRSPRRHPAVREVLPWDRLDELLPRVDFLVLACALDDTTRGLIDAGRLALMRSDAVLINVARGPVCAEADLFEALRTKRIGGAVLDVWWRYPSAADPAPRPSAFPFHELDNVIMTPHASGWTDGLFRRRGGQIAHNLDALAEGAPLINLVRAAAR
ncbi:MAG: 2-hydroxyacid dehydrogenase [Geminicoccaceae bacterium]|nr:2-hydroxyacid dehydrogenase [Geminicoccaceae bacterium]MCX8101679.1 2-hydroxyacid dehydrogenase [Geminicoccaceae bacterium]MDW8371392.1 2-hydroxyacid dehydrogenase [Geminicoccaceae bacterium]